MARVVVIGAGGHGREVAEILARAHAAGSDCEPLGFVDDDPSLAGTSVDGLPVLGGFSWFGGVDANDVKVVVALGSPPVVKTLTERARGLGLKFASAISPDAVISPHAVLEDGVIVFSGCFVSTRARLGSHCALNVGASVSHDSVVGRYAILNPGARVAGNAVVGEGCYVGMGSLISHGRSVGAWTRLGAGAVVVRDIPPHVTAVGVPAAVARAL